MLRFCFGLLIFTEEVKIAVKFLRENQHCRAKHFLLSIWQCVTQL